MSNIPKTHRRVTARKFSGDDQHSWAVFIDGRPFVTGLGRSEVPYYRAKAIKKVLGINEYAPQQSTGVQS
jgi:hypothetical protein